jgi:hypothetical protein
MVAGMIRTLQLLLLIGITALAGCVTPKAPPPSGASPPANEPYLVLQYGRVVRVNPPERFVVLECAVLPNEGQRFTLIRDQQPVAVVRVSNIMSGKHAAANIEEGSPAVGDWYMLDQQRPTTNERMP